MTIYSKEEVEKATLEYFDGDELATNVWITKYALKNNKGEFLEKTPDDMHRRLAKEFARIEAKYPNPLSENEIFLLLKDFKYIVPQGSVMFGAGNNFVNVSLSNCVVVESPKDSMSSIYEKGRDLANLFKRRCGVGINISNLRPDGAPVNNSAGSSTGAWSFADLYSYICRHVGQHGRRGALMISMDVRHPDIENFITMKHDKTKVTGANISVQITDEFMRAVENDLDFELRWPIESPTPKFVKNVKARRIWNTIVESATQTAEPGLLMWDNICSTLPANCYPEFKTLTTNPCGEVPLSAGDSCRLISINLKHFVKNPFTIDAFFDYSEYSEVVRVAMRLSDDLVDLEIEKLQNIILTADTPDEKDLFKTLLNAAKQGRRTGLGTHGLADVLARLNLAYDSDAALTFIDAIYETLKVGAYEESHVLADERGAFEVFDANLEKDCIFFKGWQDKIKPRRNISILTNAPTGSVSILSQTSSGIEPVFKNSHIRRKKLNHNEETTPDFIDPTGDKWVHFTVHHKNILEYFELKKDKEVPSFFVESDMIDWQKRVTIQGTIQKHIDHSISSTINLPKHTGSDIVSELYLLGWKSGLKGITVYVDGSRTGVLLREEDKFPQHTAPKRPEELECDIHRSSIKGEDWTIFVGLMNNKPYELFGGLSNKIELPTKYDKGFIIKRPRKIKNSVYDLKIVDQNNNTILIKDVLDQFDNSNYGTHTRLISLSLRHGAASEYLVSQLLRDKDSDMYSFSRVLARVLKKYVPDGTKPTSDKTCAECSSNNLIYQDGCVQCTSCGYGKC